MQRAKLYKTKVLLLRIIISNLTFLKMSSYLLVDTLGFEPRTRPNLELQEYKSWILPIKLGVHSSYLVRFEHYSRIVESLKNPMFQRVFKGGTICFHRSFTRSSAESTRPEK